MAGQTRTAALSARLVAARTAKKMTQAEVADAVGVSQSFVSQVERGEIDHPSAFVVRDFERALGLKPGHLTGSAVDARKNH